MAVFIPILLTIGGVLAGKQLYDTVTTVRNDWGGGGSSPSTWTSPTAQIVQATGDTVKNIAIAGAVVGGIYLLSRGGRQ